MWIFMFFVLLDLLEFQNGVNCDRKVRDVSSLKKNSFNKYLLDNVPRPYEVTFPKQIRKNKVVSISTREHKVRHHGTHEHYQQVTFQIHVEGKKHKLRLTRNEALLSAGIKVKYFKDIQQQVITQTVEHCYYHGTVKRDAWSAVALSTCNGIRGVIQLNNATYVVQPLVGGDDGMEHPHVIYKATPSQKETCGNSHGLWLPFHELHKGEFVKKLKSLKIQRIVQADDTTEEKTMKLALVLDNSVGAMLNLSQDHMLSYAIQTANIVDLYFKELKIRMALTYVELWNMLDKMEVNPKLRETMDNFLIYRDKHLHDVDHHAAHLITSINFEKDSVGMAIPDSICTGRAIGINRNPTFLEPQQGATILAHMISHNLGIKHDEDGGCECSDDYGCIMSTEVLATPDYHSRMFSTCSESDWDVSSHMGITSCLTNDHTEDSFPQTCGNRHVERGEECDCGSPEECAKSDPCCDPNTCLLKSWAQCRTGSCCKNCTYLSKNYLCRAQSSDCDVPEFCTGEDGECPMNNYAQDGHPCGNGTGYCRGGICPLLDSQCQNIWGTQAKGADFQCFEKFNPTGSFNGHCGKDERTGSFAKCLPEHIQCGLLHCEGGDRIPYYGPDKAFSKTTVFNNDMEYECKIVYGPAVLELPHMGLVQDGTKCGDGKICMDRKCISVSQLSPLMCPGTKEDVICSGHGICTKDGYCYCDDGWGEDDCSEKINVTRVVLSIDTTVAMTTVSTTETIKVIPWSISQVSGKPATSTELAMAALVQDDQSLLNTKWMIIILASVIGGLALVLGLTFLCYRRRSPGKFGKKKKKSNIGSEEDGETTSKLIKFGSTPTYKPGKKSFFKKLRSKKTKKVSEDDSDIGELPPPPTIVTDPESAKPERGILKNTFASLKFNDERRSSESNTVTSTDDKGDQESDYNKYQYDDEDDTEAGEIQDIFGYDEAECNLDKLDNLVESSSFDFMFPPSLGNLGRLNHSPSPPRKFDGYDIPFMTSTPPRPNLWKSNLQSPPKSRVLRMRNLDELLSQIDRHTIDLSPSPDDPPVQISPSTSEDVRSSSTEDRPYQNSSHDPQSPQSITSGSTCTALRPLLGSQWSKYILHRGDRENGGNFDFGEDIESPLPHINIPPPMNPINIRSIFNYGQTSLNRDHNDTPLGSQGECSSTNGTANSRNGCEKSSGYGSEHDQERFSIEDLSRTQSRSGSVSPPSYSAVIRTGPNQIKLVPAGKFQSHGMYEGEEELHKILEGLPRIDGGTYERNPQSNHLSGDLNSSITSGTSTAETLKNSTLPSEQSSMTSTLETLKNSMNSEPNSATNTLEMLKNTIPEYSNGFLPNPKPLGEREQDNNGSAPCIDRSLEEIPQALADNHKSKKKKKNSYSKPQRPVSLSVFQKQNSVGEDEDTDDSGQNKRFSALENIPVEVCEC